MDINPYLPFRGRLLDAAKQTDLNTIAQAYDIQKSRLYNPSLRQIHCWTTDTILYSVEECKCILYISGKKNNPIFKDIETLTNAVTKLTQKGHYFPKKEDIDAIIESESSLKIDIHRLQLKNDIRGSYFDIYTADKDSDEVNNYNTLHRSQRLLAEKIYGTQKDFKNIMKTLNDSGIKKTKIYVLNPYYIRKILWENNTKSFMSIPFLENFEHQSNFYTYDWDMEDEYGCLLGISKSK